MTTQRLGFWALQGPGCLLLIYLIYAQGIPAINYELGIAMGTQESAAVITEVGTSFFYGFAFADLVIYIPLLAVGLVGLWKRAAWGRVSMAAALGITIYWPAVVLAAAVKARGARGWHLDESGYWIVLPGVALWALWGLWWIVVRRDPE